MTAIKPEVPVDPNRPSIYYAVHKGLRLGHARLLTAIGANNFNDERATSALMEEVRSFLRLLKCHLDGEERENHTAIEEREAGSSATAKDEHASHERSFAQLEVIMKEIGKAPENRSLLGQSLYMRFARLFADDILHMEREETHMLSLLHRLFDDDELRALEGRVVSNIPPENLLGYMRLIMPAMNPHERRGILDDMRSGMPEEYFRWIMDNAVIPSLGAEAVSSFGFE